MFVRNAECGSTRFTRGDREATLDIVTHLRPIVREARRRTDYAVQSLANERAKIIGMLKDAMAELTQGKADLEKMGEVDPEKRKVYEGLLEKLDAAIKELAPFAKPKEGK